MSESAKTYCVFISAAEPSADAHCAGLINALKQSTYDIEFVGVGGAKMASAGCKLLETTAQRAAMTYKAFGQVGAFYKLIKRINRYLQSTKVDLVIVCDSPAFNFHIAKAAKKAGLKTLFYVAPQLWAWAAWRIRKLRKYCDKLCCILPFEQKWFTQRSIDTTYVGNPMLDELGGSLGGIKRDYTDFQPNNAAIALMPGSRTAEIDSLWLPMQRIALRIKQNRPQASFTAIAVDTEKEQLLKARQLKDLQCDYTIGSVTEVARRADISIVASGSATLQVAAAGCPMMIMYQSSKILWYLVGRWLVKTKYLSLINILAGKELVPEFMPYFASIEPIVQKCEQLLACPDKLSETSGKLIELVQPLADKKACDETAKIVLEMLT